MKRVYRWEDNAAYWERRWREAERDPDGFDDLAIYPIRYAEMVMAGRGDGQVLEIGCGLGRVLKHYHYQGRRITGIERSAFAVERLREENPSLDVRVADVLQLPFDDESFDVVMAFGVFHNLETSLDKALAETTRCLKRGGRFCISMRPDNLEMRLNELYWRWRNRKQAKGPPRFHKLLVGEAEFRELLSGAGLETEAAYRARNHPLLYRIPFLRESSPDESESSRRAGGYRLNRAGRALERLLSGFFPGQFYNVMVSIGRRD